MGRMRLCSVVLRSYTLIHLGTHLGRMILCSVVLRRYTLIPKASIRLHEDTVKQPLRTEKSQDNKIMS